MEREWSKYWFKQAMNIAYPKIQEQDEVFKEEWWYRISKNSNITWEVIQDNHHLPWSWRGISCNPNITWELIQNNPSKPWNKTYISKNPNITSEVLLKNLDFGWKCLVLSENAQLSIEFIRHRRHNLYYDFDWRQLSKNPNITWEIISNNLDLPWFWNWMSFNPNITWEIVCNNPNKPWDFNWLSYNPNITSDIMEANPDYGWNYFADRDKNIYSWQIIRDYPNDYINVDWDEVVSNGFKKEREQFEGRVKHQIFVQKHVLEAAIKFAFHPKQIKKYLDLGYSPEYLDDIM